MAIDRISAQSSAAVYVPRSRPVIENDTRNRLSSPVQISPEKLKLAIEEVRRTMGSAAQHLQFLIDKDTGATVVKVVDSATNELIRQMPSEELLAISRAIGKFQGMLLKQKA